MSWFKTIVDMFWWAFEMTADIIYYITAGFFAFIGFCIAWGLIILIVYILCQTIEVTFEWIEKKLKGELK